MIDYQFFSNWNLSIVICYSQFSANLHDSSLISVNLVVRLVEVAWLKAKAVGRKCEERCFFLYRMFVVDGWRSMASFFSPQRKSEVKEDGRAETIILCFMKHKDNEKLNVYAWSYCKTLKKFIEKILSHNFEFTHDKLNDVLFRKES